MLKRQTEPSLLLLAVLGLVLYLGVTFLSPFLNKASNLEDEGTGVPAISKAQAKEAAEQFALKQLSLSSDRQSDVFFQSYSTRSGYLQKEHLYDEYLQKYEDRFPLDYYQVEINDLRGGTTYYIDVNYTTEQLIGWQMSGAATKKKQPTAPANEQLRLAEKTLKDMEFSPEEFTLEDRSDASQGEYIFQSKTERIGDARLEVQLQISNGQVTAFHPRFSVPEAFTTWQKQQNERASLMTRVSLGVSLAMMLIALYLLIRYRREISFRRGVLLSLLFLAVYVTNNFNMLPAFRTSHGDGPSGFEALVNLWFINIIVAFMALSTYFFLSAGRRWWLKHGRTAWPSWRHPDFGRLVSGSTVRGYLICLFVLGVQQLLFFIAGEAFDVWAVSDPSDSIYNMVYPAAFPTMAWAAAISEEAAYRLFGIALFLKLTRNKFLAVLLPSVIWAMSHTQYPIYPVYTRLVEVTIIGLIFGWAFLRYGFLTVLFAHAAMDSILMGLSLMYMGELRHVLIGAVYIVLPAVIGWLLSTLHSRFKRRPPLMQL